MITALFQLQTRHFRWDITGPDGWSIEAIAMRKPYLDTTHAIQAEVLKRRRLREITEVS